MFKTIAGALVALFLCQGAAIARDNGQWEDTDPGIKAWYGSVMQPDRPDYSCCGEADAYWADSIECDADKCFAIITDERDDEPLKRLHVPAGTRIKIPPHKYLDGKGNPTGHGVIFLTYDEDTSTRIVLCYAAPSLT